MPKRKCLITIFFILTAFFIMIPGIIHEGVLGPMFCWPTSYSESRAKRILIRIPPVAITQSEIIKHGIQENYAINWEVLWQNWIDEALFEAEELNDGSWGEPSASIPLKAISKNALVTEGDCFLFMLEGKWYCWAFFPESILDEVDKDSPLEK